MIGRCGEGSGQPAAGNDKRECRRNSPHPQDEVSDSGGRKRDAAKVQARKLARAARSFAEADAIRDELARNGIRIEDLGDETRWERTAEPATLLKGCVDNAG